MLVGAITLGRELEQRAKNRAMSALQSLIALQPKLAQLITNPELYDHASAPIQPQVIAIPVEHVRVGEWLQVLPGESIPVDGELVWGRTTVDEAMLTGESLPVDKQPGDELTAGTLNHAGMIALRTIRTGKDTTLAQIIALVETAQIRKAPVQHLADTVAGYFTYAVIAIAALTFGFWYWIGTRLWPEMLTLPTVGHLQTMMSLSAHHASISATSPLLLSLKLAIAVLVVSCPCALGLATPTAILVGTGIGAETGLLIRGGDVLEQVSQLDTIVFDKTGTLTTGQPTVADCLVLSPTLLSAFETADANIENALLQLAATVEQGSCHPLAMALRQEADTRGLTLLEAANFHTEPGLGVAAVVADQPVWVGNRDWMVQQGVILDGDADAQTLGHLGKTVIYVAIASTLLGLIAIADTPRADSAETVAALKAMNLNVMLLTGDRLDVAQVIANVVGIAAGNVMAEVRPEAKAAVIEKLQTQGHCVAMVGDGINDAPALAQANVGIALHSGTDIAIETAAIVLMRDRLSDVHAAIRLSRSTFRKIWQNLVWAFSYNIVGIPLAAGVFLPNLGVFLSPAAAGVMMSFSSIGVITNSLSLRRLRLNNVARSTSKSSLDH
jgi:P-type Cu2+ transporter